MQDNNYLNDEDLEKEIIGYFLIDKSCNCISKTILQPKHFFNEYNRKTFIVLKDYYMNKKNMEFLEIIKTYDKMKSFQQLLMNYYNYANNYILSTRYFKENEERLIKKWQRKETLKLFNQYQNDEIDYKTLKIKLDEINENQFFKNILDVSKDVEDLTPFNNKKREYTNIKQLDYYTKGLEYGTLNVWSAVTNAGKTTLMTQFAKEFLKNDKKVFYFNGEQTAKEFKNNLFITMCKKEELQYVKDVKNENIIDIMPHLDILEELNKNFENKLYIYNNEIPKNDIDTMILVMEEALRKNVKIFFIDNFMQLDNSELIDQQTRIVEKFKRFARDNEAIVILVAHPRKLNFGTTRLNIFDISGTQNISNKATNICTIMRTDIMNDEEKMKLTYYLLENNYLFENCDAVIEVLKTKGNKNGVLGLKYDKITRNFTEIEKITDLEKEKRKSELQEKGGKRGKRD